MLRGMANQVFPYLSYKDMEQWLSSHLLVQHTGIRHRTKIPPSLWGGSDLELSCWGVISTLL